VTKKILIAGVLLLTAIFSGEALADSSFLKPYERASLPEVNPPKARVEVLQNGMRCYLLEDHTIPVARVRLITKTGSIYEPGDKTGLAAITGILMRSGGAGDLDPARFDAALDGLGALLSSEIGLEMGSATLESLASDLDKSLPLLFDMLFSPRMDASRLNVAKLKMEEALRREDDDPADLAAYRYRQLVYGKESPWARRPDKASLANISDADVRAFHDKYFKAGNMILAAAGDFKSQELVELLKKLTAKAPRGEVDLPPVPKVELKYKAAMEFVERPITQAVVRMGHLSIKRDNPDKYALFLLNEILGGGDFKSRLMSDIRTKRGLAYSVWSSISPGKDYGLFTVGLSTKADQAENAMKLVREHIERILKPGSIERSELAFAKQSILSSLIFEFDRAFKVVDGRARFYFYGYPDDYWRIYRDRIVAAGIADLTRVADKYLHPEDLDELVVGPRAREKTGQSSGEGR